MIEIMINLLLYFHFSSFISFKAYSIEIYFKAHSEIPIDILVA